MLFSRMDKRNIANPPTRGQAEVVIRFFHLFLGRLREKTRKFSVRLGNPETSRSGPVGYLSTRRLRFRIVPSAADRRSLSGRPEFPGKSRPFFGMILRNPRSSSVSGYFLKTTPFPGGMQRVFCQGSERVRMRSLFDSPRSLPVEPDGAESIPPGKRRRLDSNAAASTPSRLRNLLDRSAAPGEDLRSVAGGTPTREYPWMNCSSRKLSRNFHLDPGGPPPDTDELEFAVRGRPRIGSGGGEPLSGSPVRKRNFPATRRNSSPGFS